MPATVKHLLIVIAALFLFPHAAQAKLFRNAYVQFELPESWNCNPEGTEYVCSSTNKIDAKESIIVLTAKEVGPQDSFQAYLSFLKTPKQVQLSNGKTVLSQIKHVEMRKINDQQWVDALHLGSEIPGYYTRYLATVKDKLAILVTLSAHQKYYTKYSNDYFRAVESLRVVASKDLLAPRVLAPVRPTGGEQIGHNINPGLPSDTEAPPPEESGSGPNPATLAGVFLLLVAIIFIFLKKKKP